MNSIPSPIENLLDVPILSSSCGVQTAGGQHLYSILSGLMRQPEMGNLSA